MESEKERMLFLYKGKEKGGLGDMLCKPHLFGKPCSWTRFTPSSVSSIVFMRHRVPPPWQRRPRPDKDLTSGVFLKTKRVRDSLVHPMFFFSNSEGDVLWDNTG